MGDKGDETMAIEPYLFFDGHCEEAIEFYGRALGAKATMLMRFKESPDPGSIPPGSENKVMHANVQIGDGTVLMSDGHSQGKPSFAGFGLSLTASSDAQVDRYFNALTAGGTVQQPLTSTFFSSRFGMVTDRFGVLWLIYVAS
jgi:PhnB protein